MAARVVAALAALEAVAATEYKLQQSLVGSEFFTPNYWTFFTEQDPTWGAVRYVDMSTAMKLDMIQTQKSNVLIRPALAGIKPGDMIPSVRLESKERYDSGLFILSMTHQPAGCGVWPAFWMTGDNPEHPWPTWGEADFLEGSHAQNEVWTTLHTWEGCDQSALKSGTDFSGRWMPGQWYKNASTNCSVIDGSQQDNEGCPIVGPAGSMGPRFNVQGGGTFAFEWNPDSYRIQAFFWETGKEPADVVAGKPDVESWGMPYAKFTINTPTCPKRLFQKMKVVLNTDFCGMWGQLDVTFHKECPKIEPNMTCNEWVSTYPGNLTEAWWNITRFDIFQKVDASEDEIVV